jgi:hypothetical protein
MQFGPTPVDKELHLYLIFRKNYYSF